MGKKTVKIDGKTFVIDDKNLEEVDVANQEDAPDNKKSKDNEEAKDNEEDKKDDESKDDEVEAEEKKYDKEDIDKAADNVMDKLGIGAMKSDIASIKKSFEKKADKKISGLIDLEKLMKKNVEEMTSREKIIGFFSALVKDDVPVLKALSEGTAADGGLRKYSPIYA